MSKKPAPEPISLCSIFASRDAEINQLKLELAEARKKYFALETQIQEQKARSKWERLAISLEREFWKNPYERLLKIVEEEFSCAFCLKVCIEATVITCGHQYCGFCWRQWQKERTNANLFPCCPTCRATVFTDAKHVAVNSFLEKLHDILPDQLKEKRQRRILKRKAQEEKVDTESKSGTPPNFSALPTVLVRAAEAGLEHVFNYPATPPPSPTG